MIVYVVLCDCGLNGAWIEAVRSDRAEADTIAAAVNKGGRSLTDSTTSGHYTGFGGAEVIECEIDGPVSES